MSHTSTQFPLSSTSKSNKSVTPSPTKTPTKFPLLNALGIDPNFDTVENKDKIKKVLAKLVSLHKKQQQIFGIYLYWQGQA